MRFCFYALKNYYKPYNILKKIYEILKKHFPLSHFVFGSDWPHTNFEANVNFSSVLTAFNEIVVSKKEQEQILGDNACALFGF
ncbi:conserved hypothetical protein [Campylobacter jejuni subsp. doylei 269.97]|uniref:Amidohydrolase-related domain-containing protein n=1 Tax=Campylobacter jejuni subsp. doylei (strain ATCC BAA-1458 / RM4099 / 269.97) TaxID=360109 RepID=A7H4I7_CAMJD|nr:conserved hypothetical protein [Campylobacter jejuni subsp. doylei 269.97]